MYRVNEEGPNNEPVRKVRPPGRGRVKWVVATDIDGTITGDPHSLNRFHQGIQKRRKRKQIVFVLSTGRTLPEVVLGQKQEGIPEADAIISQVGTEIYLPPFDETSAPLDTWHSYLSEGINMQEVTDLMSQMDAFDRQDQKYNTPLKRSYELKKEYPPEIAYRRAIKHVKKISKNLRIIWSHSRYLDIVPKRAGKGKAICFLLKYWGLDHSHTIVAGNSGNDIDMFQGNFKGIAVQNSEYELLRDIKKLGDAHIYISSSAFASGVMEGLEHFGMW